MTPNDGRGSIHTHSIPCVCNCLSACRRLSRAVHFRTFGRRLSDGAPKRAICAGWLNVSSPDYHQSSSPATLPSAAASVSSCRPARKIHQMGVVDKLFKSFPFPTPARVVLVVNSFSRTAFDARKLVRHAATWCAAPPFSLICGEVSPFDPSIRS